MNERVCSEALVMPKRIGPPVAGSRPASTAFWFASSNSALSTCSPLSNVVPPLVAISHF